MSKDKEKISVTAAELDVHPVAALFPMLAEDELADMAADIKERGLLQAIVLDDRGRILDGRNRHAACKIAGVEPRFTTYTGDDPDGYALATNIVRRSLTKGQAAMIIAKAGIEYRNDTRNPGAPSKQRVSHARVVLQFAGPSMADRVVAGTTSLDLAYQEAQRIKAAAEGEGAQLERLREADPDLADKVIEGELTLAGAQAELRARAEQVRRTAVAYQTVILKPAQSLAQLFAGTDPEDIGDVIAQHPALFEDGSPSDLEKAADGLARVAESWRKNAAEA